MAHFVTIARFITIAHFVTIARFVTMAHFVTIARFVTMAHFVTIARFVKRIDACLRAHGLVCVHVHACVCPDDPADGYSGRRNTE